MADWIMLPYPVGANRVWRNVHGRVIPNPAAIAWKRTAAYLVRLAGVCMKSCEMELHYKLHPRQNKDGTASKSRLDLDAPLKAAMDALNGIAWKDDKQVVRLIGEIGEPVKDGGLSIRIQIAGETP